MEKNTKSDLVNLRQLQQSRKTCVNKQVEEMRQYTAVSTKVVPQKR